MSNSRFPARSLCFLLSLAGCATAGLYGDLRTDGACHQTYIDEKRLAQELQSARSCCTDLSVIPYEAFVVTKETQFILTKTSPVYDFPSGRSRLAAFALGPEATGYMVVSPGTSGGRTSMSATCADFKHAFTIGGGSERYRAIEPIATFLGADRQILRAGVPALSHDTGDYRIPIPDGAKFAVVHTDPNRYGRDRQIFVNPTSTAVVMPGVVPGTLFLTGPSSLSALTTATGIFVVTFRQ